MIRFALIVASTLGFVLTAAMGNLIVPLLRAFQSRQQPTRPPEPERPEMIWYVQLCLLCSAFCCLSAISTAAMQARATATPL